MVERKAIVHAVGSARVHHAGKRVAREHHAIVVHVGGLRQPGGAGRVDVERAVLDGEGRTVGRRELRAGEAVDRAVDAREIGVGIAVQPDLGVAGEVRARARKRIEQFRGDHDVLGADHIDAVRQCGPGQVGVEQRHHAADMRDADPDGQEFRAARHHQADGVALGHALRQRPAGVAVRTRVELAVAEALAVGQQRRRVAVFVREFGDNLREDAGRIAGDRCGCMQGAQRPPQAGRVGRQPLDDTHDQSRPAPSRDSRPVRRGASGSARTLARRQKHRCERGRELRQAPVSGRARRTGSADCR